MEEEDEEEEEVEQKEKDGGMLGRRWWARIKDSLAMHSLSRVEFVEDLSQCCRLIGSNGLCRQLSFLC